MKGRSWIEAALLALIGAAAAIEGLRLLFQKDPNTLYDVLGPGLYILALGVAVLGTACALARNNRAGAAPSPQPLARRNLRMIGTVGALAGYTLLLSVTGYLVASLAFFLVEFRLTGTRSWLAATVLSVCYAAAFYLVFVSQCNLVFPRGLLFP